eukprot:12920346-Ditylum_brightwellii.AAC.1
MKDGNNKTHVLKFECNLYGQKQAGIFSGPNLAEIDQAIFDLKEAKLDIEGRGRLQDYLGISMSG